jgi:hypothetical protein
MGQQHSALSDVGMKMWLETEEPKETDDIERKKKRQKEREKELAEQRNRQRKQAEEPTSATTH